jgi:hypothetical protein
LEGGSRAALEHGQFMVPPGLATIFKNHGLLMGGGTPTVDQQILEIVGFLVGIEPPGLAKRLENHGFSWNRRPGGGVNPPPYKFDRGSYICTSAGDKRYPSTIVCARVFAMTILEFCDTDSVSRHSKHRTTSRKDPAYISHLGILGHKERPVTNDHSREW